MPDLNSVPPSPHVLAASRRASQQALAQPAPSQTQAQMPPPPSPSLNILPSNQSAVQTGQPVAPPLPSPPLPQGPLPAAAGGPGSASAVAGPGPLRHPQPLTPADLHMQMEKEQEARINRLSRELSHLRAQHNASVVSNASSTSASASGAEQPVDTHLLSGPGFAIPSTRRHHRSSSNTSTRSQTAALLGTSIESSSRGGASARATAGGGSAVSLSRQNSTASHRSRTSSPAPPHLTLGESSTYSYFQQQQRIPIPAAPPTGSSSVVATPGSLSDQLSPGLLPATSRYEETAFFRSELDSVKRENESLKRRIRELERQVRERRRESDASRTRSESVSTTTSTGAAASVAGGSAAGGGLGIAGPREERGGRPTERERGMTTLSLTGSVGVGVPEEEVRVGESAASAGLGEEGQGRE